MNLQPRNTWLYVLGTLIAAATALLEPVQAQTNANPRTAIEQGSMSSLSTGAMAPSTNLPASLTSGGAVIVSSSAAQTTIMPQLVLRNGGALFQSTAFSATFANDISSPGAVEVLTSDGQHIKAAIYGLAYVDFASGRSVLLAQLRPTSGQMLSPTKLIFPNCFDSGIAADVEFDVSGNSIEQLVVLRKQIPGPDAFNLPETSRLAVITAFDAPVPAQILSLIDLRLQNQLLSVQGEASMQDATLVFGSMRMASGKAWSMDGAAQPIPVAKNWQTFQGFTGQYLVESAPYALLRPQLDTLPTASIFPQRKIQNVRDMLKRQPAPIINPRSSKPIEIAKTSPDAAHGVVLDWVLVTSTLLDINFGSGAKTGPAAIGYTTNDTWNICNTAYQTPFTMTNLAWSDGTGSGTSVTVVNGQGLWGNGSPDPMYNSYLYPWGSGDINIYLTNLPAGTYDFYVYGHGPSTDGNSVYDLWVNQTEYGLKGTTMWGSGWNTTNWEGGQQYVVWRNVSVPQTNTIFLDVQHGASGGSLVNGMQIVPSGAISHAPPAMYRLIDVDFGGTPQEVGFAAVGIATNDTWNWYGNSYYGLTSGSMVPLDWSDGASAGAGMLVTNAPGFWGGTNAGDNMYDTYVYANGSGHIGIVLTNLSTAGLNADFYLYGHTGTADDNAVFQLTTGGTNYGPRGTSIWGTSWANANWEEGAQYIVFRNIPIATNQPVFIDVQPGSAGYSKINGLQIAIPLDRDGNGLPDWWEMEYFGHTGVDPNGQPGHYGLSNLQASILGLNPTNAPNPDTSGTINLQVYTPLK